MCGIVGIFGQYASQKLYDALLFLQHRGQDSAGIVTVFEDRLYTHKGRGLVRHVFNDQHIQHLQGSMGVGHVRYPTAGAVSINETQPMYVNYPYGVVIAHNGNLINTDSLRQFLTKTANRHINSYSDSEILLNIFSHILHQVSSSISIECIFKSIQRLYEYCEGGYAVVSLILGIGIIGFRDPFGIRPLVLGKKVNSDQTVEYMFASESAALTFAGFDFVRDIAPGECVIVDLEGNLYSKICFENSKLYACLFEYIYFARPDSIIDQVSVYKARLRMGEKLADRILNTYEGNPHDIDVVIPIPDTGRTSALTLAHKLNIKYREGFFKNRYVGRTFIMPGQSLREKSVRQKLSVVELEFKGKNVLLLDDSIVRGTTIKLIIELARKAGANKVYMAVASPPIRYPNVYGIDMPVPEELIAHNRSIDEVQTLIGADWLIYQTLEDMKACIQEGNEAIEGFEDSVFSGNYISGKVDEEYLAHLSEKRSDIVMKQNSKEKSYSIESPSITL